MNADESTEALGGYYDELKQFDELREKYEGTHHAAPSGHSTHFTDPKTGYDIPYKFFQSGKKEGQRAKWPKLYKRYQENKAFSYKLRKEFSNGLWLLERSRYQSVQSFLEAYESGEYQEKWG